MKQDWELIREVLIKLEEKPFDHTTLSCKDFTGYDSQELVYNVLILSQDGLVNADFFPPKRRIPTDFALLYLTGEGQKLLKSIKHDNVWNKIKNTLNEKSVDGTYEIIKSLGVAYLKKLTGL